MKQSSHEAWYRLKRAHATRQVHMQTEYCQKCTVYGQHAQKHAYMAGKVCRACLMIAFLDSVCHEGTGATNANGRGANL